MNDIKTNYYDNLVGCGTSIKWSFEGAKYQKGTKVFDKEKSLHGEITSSYHYGGEDTRAYFIKWENGQESDYTKEKTKEYVESI